MGRHEYIQQLNASILNAKKNTPITIDESSYGSGLLHEVLPCLSKRLDVPVVVIFPYDHERYRSYIPAGTVVTKYIREDNTTNIDKIVDDFNAQLL